MPGSPTSSIAPARPCSRSASSWSNASSSAGRPTSCSAVLTIVPSFARSMSVLRARCRPGGGLSPAAAAPVGAQRRGGLVARRWRGHGTTWEGRRRESSRPAAAPDCERGDGDEGCGRAGDRVDEVVVAGRRHGHGHHDRMEDEEGAQDPAPGGAEADDGDEQAPADVHARHRRIRVEADPGDPAAVVARHADGVRDPE